VLVPLIGWIVLIVFLTQKGSVSVAGDAAAEPGRVG